MAIMVDNEKNTYDEIIKVDSYVVNALETLLTAWLTRASRALTT